MTIAGPERSLGLTPTVIYGQTAILIHSEGYEGVEIIDVAGRMVDRFTTAGMGSPTTWDLHDGRGRRVPPATFSVVHLSVTIPPSCHSW